MPVLCSKNRVLFPIGPLDINILFMRAKNFDFYLIPNCFYLQIQLLADLNLKKTPQLVELVEDNSVSHFLITLLIFFPYDNIFFQMMFVLMEVCKFLIMHFQSRRMLRSSWD